MCGRDRQKSTTWSPEILSWLCQGSLQVYPPTDPSSSKYSPSRAPSSVFPDSHFLLSSHVPSVPPTPPLSSQTHGTSVYPTSSVTVWPWYVKSLFPYKIGKEAEIWPSDISVFPRSHRGLAYWPVDKYFLNWWMTAAGISGPTHLLLALVGLVLSCMGTSIVSTSIFLKVWKPFSNTL